MLAQQGAAIIVSLPTIRVPTLAIILGHGYMPFIAPCEYMAKKIPWRAPRGDQGRRPLLQPRRWKPEAFTRVLLGISPVPCVEPSSIRREDVAVKPVEIGTRRRVEQTWSSGYGPTRPNLGLWPDAAPGAVERHRDWLAPHFMDARAGASS